jgi:hypothetical protein
MNDDDRLPGEPAGPGPEPPSTGVSAPAGSPPTDGAVAPPPTDPASAGPDTAVPAWTEPQPPKRRPKALLLGAVALAAALVGSIGGKILIGFLAVNVAGAAISAVFGGPWERLPGDVRAGYEQRLKTAVGDRLDGLSEEASTGQFRTWLNSGYLRLDDERLIRHLELEIEALGRAEEPVCAAFGRQSMTGTEIDDETATKLIGSLEQAELAEWIGLNVDAVEAEMRGAPPPSSVTDAEVSPVIQILIGGLDQQQIETFAAIDAGQSAADAEVCSAIRALYQNALFLDPPSKAIMARLDVQPSQ